MYAKISSFLSKVDLVIWTQQQELDKWKELKKGMLQEMFPKEGESAPEIRFSGFGNPWEQFKLGDLGTFKNGMNFSKEAMDKGYPFVNLQNIFGRNIINTEN